MVRCASDRYLYLLLRAYRYWDFPKGMVEPSENALAAACREVKEETGLVALDFRWGDVCFETEPYASNKIARYYLAFAATADVRLGVNRGIGRPEHHEYRWLDYQTARGLLGPRVAAVLDWAHDALGDHC